MGFWNANVSASIYCYQNFNTTNSEGTEMMLVKLLIKSNYIACQRHEIESFPRVPWSRTSPTQTDSPSSVSSFSSYTHSTVLKSTRTQYIRYILSLTLSISSHNWHQATTLGDTHNIKNNRRKTNHIHYSQEQMALCDMLKLYTVLKVYTAHLNHIFEGLLLWLQDSLVGTHTFLYLKTDAFLHKILSYLIRALLFGEQVRQPFP